VTGTPPDLRGVDLGGVEVGRVLRTTGKSWLAEGRLRGRPVVIKVLTSAEPPWPARFAHEIGVYRALAQRPAPVRTPAVVHTDGARVLVVDRLPGRPLSVDRYPAVALPDADVDAVVRALDRFSRWDVGLTPVFDYRERVDRYHRHGIVDDRSRAVLHDLLTDIGPPDRPAHGDPVPSNLMIDGGVCGLLDFEFTGLFLPGFDLAVLHTALIATPSALQRVRALVADAGIEDAFLVNRAIVLSREVHNGPDDGRRARWHAVVRELHARGQA
jgi:hypothetical protein